MKKKWYQIPLLSGFVVAVILCFLGISYLAVSKKNTKRLFLENGIRESERNFNTVTTSLGRYVGMYFDLYIKTPEVLDILKKAKYGTKDQKDIARVELFRKLYPVYGKMYAEGLKQFHFHTPDSRSFLRFHKPYIFGDSLTGVRYSVTKVNQTLKATKGFEGGRSWVGYRYIYPVSDMGEHLGSVELGINFEEIRKSISESYEGTEIAFMIKRSTYEKLFDEPKRLYTVSDFSDNWLTEDINRELYTGTKPLSKNASNLLRNIKSDPVFLSHIDTGQKSAADMEINGVIYEIINLPVYDLSGKLTATIIFMGKSETVTNLEHAFFIKSLFVFALSLLTGGLVLFNLVRLNRVKELENFSSKLADTVFTGIYCLDNRGKLAFINDRALKILGYEKFELLNQNVHNKIHSHKYPLEQCPVFNVVKSGIPYQGEEIFIRKNGETFPVKVKASPMYMGSKITGAVTVFEDMTLEKKREANYKLSIKKAEEAERTKSNFIKVVNHQMTPQISAIKMSAEILKNSSDTDKKMSTYYEIMENSVSALQNIAKSIKSAEEVNKIVLSPDYFSFHEFLEILQKKYSWECEKKGIEFLTFFQEPLPKFIFADRLRLIQMVECILDNAVKFTEKGYVKFSVNTKQTIDNKTKIHLAIEDTGVGILDIHIKNVTEPYSKVNLSAKGIGTGLFIFRQILENMGGTFDIQSRKAAGTVVDIWMDFQSNSEDYSQPGKNTLKIEDARIFVGEYNSKTGRLLKDYLENLGGSVALAVSSSEAVNILNNEKFDLAVINGEFLDSENVSDILKQKNWNTPTAVLWNDADAIEKKEILPVTVKVNLFTPLDFDKLREFMTEYLPSQKIFIKNTNKTDDDKCFFDELLKIFGDRETVLNILNIYINDMPVQFEAFVNFGENSDIDGMKKILHKIKGASLNIHAFEIAKLAENAMKEIEFDNSEVFKTYYNSFKKSLEEIRKFMEISETKKS